ncbi:MAG: hypothetical protein PUP92_23355 [Rhizonema sp. PD38]|nr:hypothetical protein [Rhizonema sp. PD38]
MNFFKDKNYLKFVALILGTAVLTSILLGYDGVITVEVRPYSVRLVLDGRHDHLIDFPPTLDEQRILPEKSKTYLTLPKQVIS